MARKLNQRMCNMLADFFTVLAHPVRIRIFCALKQRPRTVSQIAAYAAVALPNVSQHLRLLRDKGAVLTEKRAQRVYYRVADPRLLQAADLVRKLLLAQTRSRARQAAGLLWPTEPQPMGKRNGHSVKAIEHIGRKTAEKRFFSDSL